MNSFMCETLESESISIRHFIFTIYCLILHMHIHIGGFQEIGDEFLFLSHVNIV